MLWDVPGAGICPLFSSSCVTSLVLYLFHGGSYQHPLFAVDRYEMPADNSYTVWTLVWVAQYNGRKLPKDLLMKGLRRNDDSS